MKKIIYSLFLYFTLFGGCGDDDTNVVDILELAASIDITNNAISESIGTITFSVTLDQTNTTGIDISIPYDVSGTATEGSDFLQLDGQLTIAAGSSTVSEEITLIDDEEIEDTETIIISLVTVAAITIDEGTLTISVSDNDGDGEACSNDNGIDDDLHECDNDAGDLEYQETVNDGARNIKGSGIPNHDYGNQFEDFPPGDPNSDVEVTDQNYDITFAADPILASTVTSILDNNGRPAYAYGIALNAVPIDPAPAEPFIFENTETGEYNWDWVFEPNNNADAVGLDCAVAHVQPDGAYHYHGDMGPFAEIYSAGISSGTPPSSVVQIGWAADGFPILYRYGPNETGDGLKLLEPSYQLKTGERPGDGTSAPCGPYNGKYTNDYEFVEGLGDLDECNGISRAITLNTVAGQEETFSYFYVITESFPIIGRCLSGTPDSEFSKR